MLGKIPEGVGAMLVVIGEIFVSIGNMLVGVMLLGMIPLDVQTLWCVYPLGVQPYISPRHANHWAHKPHGQADSFGRLDPWTLTNRCLVQVTILKN